MVQNYEYEFIVEVIFDNSYTFVGISLKAKPLSALGS